MGDFKPTYKQLFSGHLIDLADPKTDDIFLIDILTSLDRTLRWDGHTTQPISVAQHSLLVASLVGWQARPYALLHDAHEAYIGDIGTPVAYAISAHGLTDTKYRLDECIWQAFGLEPPSNEIEKEVKAADLMALSIERNRFLKAGHDFVWDFLPEPLKPTTVGIPGIDFECNVFDTFNAELSRWCPRRPPVYRLNGIEKRPCDTTPDASEGDDCAQEYDA